MTPTQMEGFRKAMKVREGHEWDHWKASTLPERDLRNFSARPPFSKGTDGSGAHHPRA